MPSRNVQPMPVIAVDTPWGDANVMGLDSLRASADFVQTQQALGASIAEAVGVAAELHGLDAIRPILNEAMNAMGSSEKVALLEAIAAFSPTTSNAVLNDLLASGHLPIWDDLGSKGYFFHRPDWITCLPDGLEVAGDLELLHASAITHLPAGLSVKGMLNATGCTALVSVPADMAVDQGCVLGDCTALRSLPDGLRVGQRSLTLRGCTALERLPEGLQVQINLDLHGCASLKTLPAGLKVGHALTLTNCPSWDGQIPEDAQVGHLVRTDQHSYGIPLAEWRDAHPDGQE